jgi:hypothetical protein
MTNRVDERVNEDEKNTEKQTAKLTFIRYVVASCITQRSLFSCSLVINRTKNSFQNKIFSHISISLAGDKNGSCSSRGKM